MYPNEGYTPPQQERRRRSDRYIQKPTAGETSSTPGRQQQQVYQPYPRQREEYQPPVQNAYQGYPPQQPQGWQAAAGQGYSRGYCPQMGNRQTTPVNYGTMPPVSPKQKKPGENWKMLVILAAVVILLAGGTVTAVNAAHQAQMQDYVTSFDTVFCPNVYVDGIHLGGMTEQEAMSAVTAQAQQRSDSWSVRLTYQGQLVTELTSSQLGMTVDVTETLRKAWAEGHTGNVQQRMAAMEALAKNPYFGYTALPSGNTAVVDQVLAELKSKVYRAPRDAMLVQFNPESETQPFTYQEEVVGRELDTEPIKQKIYRMLTTMESGSIEIEPVLTQPQVTVADLEKQVTLRGKASTTVSYRSTENRTNNIRRAFQLISGTIIQPGGTFSFNSIVGPRTVENGFYEAVEYAYGSETVGIGGGVCQASSTVYQAAVEAGMKITKREQHSLAVNYADYGYDATVLWSSNRKIDLAFKNTTDSPIYIAASVQMDPSNRKQWIAKVSIYGMDMGNVTYRLETDEPQVLDAPTEVKYVKDKKQQYVTYVGEEKVVQKASNGYVIDSYCVKYVDGVATERTHLYTDRYEPKPKTVYVGVKER